MPDDLPIDLTKTPLDRDHSKFTLVGGGIASLAAAAFLIRDGDIPGHNITILEESSQLGGSLDAAGSAETGYHLRGGRMFEAHYACTFGLFADIPTLDGSQSVTQETMAWNLTLPTASKSRLMRDGVRQTAPPFGLSEKQILRLAWLLLEPESMLSDSRVQDHVDRDFFTTNFWLLWSTTFAFQPWHSAVEFKRYLLRFAHMTAGLNRLQGILRTRFNQYDSMVRPLQSWLDQRGVRIMLHSRVTDMTLLDRRVTELTVKQHGVSDRLSIGGLDYVLATLGSMTEGASWGDMEHAAPQGAAADGGAWPLWRKIAADRPELGRPETFSDHIDQSRWLSFTVTLRERLLLDLVQKKTGNVAARAV